MSEDSSMGTRAFIPEAPRVEVLGDLLEACVSTAAVSAYTQRRRLCLSWARPVAP